jgi:hypothetical protein
MRKILLSLGLCLLFSYWLSAQIPPQGFNYSAVARNASGQPISTSTIGIQISILKTSTLGSTVYSENHFVNTDAFGLFNLIVGGGAVQSGSMLTIDWSNDNYYLKVGMDANGGTNFLTMGTTQLLSVPYAMYAKNAGSVNGVINETDPIFNNSIASGISSTNISNWNNKLDNELDPLFVSSVAHGITTTDTSNWNNKQNQLIAGSNISISGNTISSTACFSHFIGEEFGGGVIFHLWKDAQGTEHGLIVDITDLSLSQVWSNLDQTYIGASAQSCWDGFSNSNAIVGQAGHASSAGALCLNSTNGAQSDWYLPSVQELNMLWNNYFTVARKLTQISGATQLQPGGYWSSTERDFNLSAFSFRFATGDAIGVLKSNTSFVRAIRSF